MKFLPKATDQKLNDLRMISEQTHSELDYFQFELKFFYMLIDKYFQPITEGKEFSEIQSVIVKMKALEKKEEIVIKTLNQFRKSYYKLAVCSDLACLDKLNESLQKLHEAKQDLFYSFRLVKSAIFAFIEKYVKSEDEEKLLTEPTTIN